MGGFHARNHVVLMEVPQTIMYSQLNKLFLFFYGCNIFFNQVIKSLEKENSTMKSKLRRLEEDNLKKVNRSALLIKPFF